MSGASPATPHLTPQFCFNERALRDFLRLSRSTLDDTISTHLNSLSTPSTTHSFSPLSVSQKRPTASLSSTRTLPSSTCRSFVDTTLFPHWSSRDSLLSYCSVIATSPDPEDPDLVTRTLEAERQSLKVVNERLDPYSGRWFPPEARTERLRDVLANEGFVERIVRERVWSVVEDRCRDAVGPDGGTSGKGWEGRYDQWRREEERQNQR